MLNGFFDNLDILIYGLGRATPAGLVDKTNQAFGVESVDRFEDRLNGCIRCQDILGESCKDADS
jgi:hypothetical protein